MWKTLWRYGLAVLTVAVALVITNSLEYYTDITPLFYAAIVCSGNVCWHTDERYEYPATAGVVVHEDTWKSGPSVTFREHEGRGYWRGDSWTAW